MSNSKPKLFVLDTNVLMHDPTALFRFQEHNIYLTMTVLEELDQGKKGMSEVARNVRQVNRFIDDMMTQNKELDIKQGLPLQQINPHNSNGVVNGISSGRLYFETEAHSPRLPASLPGGKNDNSILGTVLALHEEWIATSSSCPRIST